MDAELVWILLYYYYNAEQYGSYKNIPSEG